jgi:hypothetical protein
MSATRFPFRFAPAYLAAALPFGVTPRTAWVQLDDHLTVRFGPWHLRTSLSNITGVEQSWNYSFVKTAGPAHLSFTDRGVTFATNGDRGLCVCFGEPVRALWPLSHPGATMTVADIDGLQQALGF